MGICETCESKKQEMGIGRNYSVQVDVITRASKSICKITIKRNPSNINATGFFMEISDTKKYLITNYHIINQSNIYDDIEIEIDNQKTIKLNLNNREIKYFPKPKDITMIEIKNNDEIYNDILFLKYDLNYKQGYGIYKNSIVFLLEHSNGDNTEYACGKIVNINNFEFDHDIATENDASGSPIILYTKSINSIQVIGIHKEANYTKNLNSGTFIGEIFNDNSYDISNYSDKNYIIAEIEIKDYDINKDIRIINSYEENRRNNYNDEEINKELMNEEEIKKCQIKINNILIPFNYFYKFTIKGKYIIKYSFNNYLTKTNYMFSGCSSLININLSDFNMNKVSNMRNMFCGCSSLTSINLSNCNTQNVIDMSGLFSCCSSLTNIDLSNFNTQNVKDMKNMFFECSSLRNINLSNFNTQNVTDMSYMFALCTSLRNINLSNFNTQNVTNMSYMFWICASLTYINLSNFNTQNVIDMNAMFFECLSLKNLNLSYFNTQKLIRMNVMFYDCKSLENLSLNNFKTQDITENEGMFFGCSNLKKENLIANDEKIQVQTYCLERNYLYK